MRAIILVQRRHSQVHLTRTLAHSDVLDSLLARPRLLRRQLELLVRELILIRSRRLLALIIHQALLPGDEVGLAALVLDGRSWRRSHAVFAGGTRLARVVAQGDDGGDQLIRTLARNNWRG